METSANNCFVTQCVSPLSAEQTTRFQKRNFSQRNEEEEKRGLPSLAAGFPCFLQPPIGLTRWTTKNKTA